jgi:L-2-hydroxyglutarate oxidase LhgO
MDRFETEVVIIGAGVVGLACGAAFARTGAETIVLESETHIGSGISSRNSEVIHAGIYYPTDSLKHQTCIEGRRALYQYADERGLSYKKCGKLIVATSEAEDVAIENLAQRGSANSVEGLNRISRDQATRLEPELYCTSALHSTQTGIIDSHGFMLALQGEIEDNGGYVICQSTVDQVTVLADGRFELSVLGTTPAKLVCEKLVNAAGLHAQDVAGRMEFLPASTIPRLFLAKGSYFQCTSKAAFSRLIYPAPVDGGLGVHVTLDMQGRMKFGPDVEWLDHADPSHVKYDVDLSRASQFYQAIRRYWPGLPDGAIVADYAGCRPKLSGPGMPAADFMIQGSEAHLINALINLFGIESPGLTASLSIASHVYRQLKS